MVDVIGAGFGRTGTASLKAALEHLGFGPYHHMFEVVAHPPNSFPGGSESWPARTSTGPAWRTILASSP